MSNPSRPLGSSCTLGVARLRSVKFALVRTRRKGGGACELSSAELPFIRPFASSASTLRFRGSACISDERVCISWWTYIFPDRVRVDQYALLSRSLSEPLQSIEIVKLPANFLEHLSITVAFPHSFISFGFVELSVEAFSG